MMKRRFACASLVLALFFSGSATHAFAEDKDHHPDTCKDHPAKCRDLPEAPIPLGLPLAGIVVAGGYMLLVRRHDQPAKPAATA